ncbi:TetR family transcriptional regulator [Streptomyces sp. Je 1-79]|uniref:TetR/AcrR family transcriptional regulator n=1 Tax=Streptomyces sp. Je 1-79 TaxID=2943847 RepID=UPI0021A97042|nr:TetR family transcriptional regulator [Streptomyces sp. Je 1-79]MCT4352071.1 TetR family transcriptional regulator [Streptomyces sp. Je 1-79]
MQGKPGTSTRQAIHAAAGALFRQQGYAKTTVRQIAAAAGSDPALVIRHFKSKELLFLETMQLTIDDEPLLDVPPEHLGERLVDLVLGLDGGARGVFLALVHGSNEPEIRKRLTDTHEKVLIEPLRRRLSGPDADVRARLAASVTAGLLYSLWIARDETLLATDRARLIARYGALIQHILTPAA